MTPSSVVHPYRRFKQLNVVFPYVKALAQAALITLAGAGCVGFCEEISLAKQSPEKLLETATFTTKMATTLDHVTGARLSWTNK